MSYKRYIRWAGLSLATALLLPTALLLALYIPSVQQAVTSHVTRWLSSQSGLAIEAAGIRVHFPLRLELQGLHIDTLLSMERFATSIHLRSLTHGAIEASYVIADNLHYRATSRKGQQIQLSSERLRLDDISYRWREHTISIEGVLLTDGSFSLCDTVVHQADGATSPLPIALSIHDVQLRRVATTYTDATTCIESSAGDIALRDITIRDTMQMALTSIVLQEGTLHLRSHHRSPLSLTAIGLQADSLRYHRQHLSGAITQLTFTETQGLHLQEGTLHFTWDDGHLSLPYLTLRTPHSHLAGHLHTSFSPRLGDSIECAFTARIGYADLSSLMPSTPSTHKLLGCMPPDQPLGLSVAIEGTQEQLQISHCRITLPTMFALSIQGSTSHITDPTQREVQCHWDIHTYDLSKVTTLLSDTIARHLTIPYGVPRQGDLRDAPDTLHTACTIVFGQGSTHLRGGYRPSNATYTLQVETDSLDLQQLLPDSQWGIVSLQGQLSGQGNHYMHESTSMYGAVQLHTLGWDIHTFSHASAQFSLSHRTLRLQASCLDTLMRWELSSAIRYAPDRLHGKLHLRVDDLHTQSLRLSDTPLRPSFQCRATIDRDSTNTYTLSSRFSDIVLSTPTRTLTPDMLDLYALLSPDTLAMAIRSGDLSFTASTHPWSIPLHGGDTAAPTRGTKIPLPPHLYASLSAGADNPLHDYLELMGIKAHSLQATIITRADSLIGQLRLDSLSLHTFHADRLLLTATYTEELLQARLQPLAWAYHSPQLELLGHTCATFTWRPSLPSEGPTGMLHLTDLHCSMPAYSLYLHTRDTLTIPLAQGKLHFHESPLYTSSQHPLRLNGYIALLAPTPTMQLRLTAHDANLLQSPSPHGALLYGTTSTSADILISGLLNDISITGNLRIGAGSSIHYIYKDAILTANNQLSDIVTFTDFSLSTPSGSKKRFATHRFTLSLNLSIDATVLLEVQLGASKQNTIVSQGGGIFNLHYTPSEELRLSGTYTITSGSLRLNVPLLHVSHMVIRPGSTIAWSGSLTTPQLDLTAEERIRTSVTLDGAPQSVLFVSGLSITGTPSKIGLQFTLSAPESASMQNRLAALSPEERSKLSVALLTTGLYLGEGGTGNLMSTAFVGLLQSQLDNISRDIFRTIDISVGIDALPDGINGVSTRTDYSFSLAKRLWNDRIRIVIGGRVTTTGDRIADNTVIHNISIEWRITPNSSQYLRFFYDRNYESILEGEIRETGIGYVYRRKFGSLSFRSP